VSETPELPYGGAGDSQAGSRSLADRFRRHAESLTRSNRSPLYIQLMRAAADDIDREGPVTRLFADIPVPPGSVPQLRLLGALHYLVLSGQAPGLAEFYPSAGGSRPPDGAWPAAQTTIDEHFEQIRSRLHRTVQTNEPGRSPVLFVGLLWLADRHRRPIRLLELGASAGLNLLADRYAYQVSGHVLGDPASPLRFVDPWTPPPPIDLNAAAAGLRITARAGCDPAPLDPTNKDDRVTLLSYIWLSRRGELHPPALADPGVSLSTHRARVIRPSAARFPSGRIGVGPFRRSPRGTALSGWDDRAVVCISAWPSASGSG